MIGDLRTMRLARWQLVGLISLSALSSALIIATATGGQTGARPAQVLALLTWRRPIVRHLATPPSPSAPDAGLGSSAPSPSSAASAGAGSGSSGAGSTSAGAGARSGSGSSSGTGTPSGNSNGSPGASDGSRGTRAKFNARVKHVFVIALSTTSYAAAFGPRAAARYLNHELRRSGTLLSGYRSLGGSELPDYLAMVSGQAPNPDTRGNCAVYNDFPQRAKPNTAGLVSGRGCVYPNTVITLGDQVTAAGATWRGYIADMGKTKCVHPSSGAQDNALLPPTGTGYDTRHNPFIYFHSLLDLGDCASDDMNLDALPAALTSARKTPMLSFIAPPLCDDAASKSCPGGLANGLAGEDAFLKTWVPRITASAAYKTGGVLMIVFAPSRPAAGTGAASVPQTQTFTPLVTSASATPMRTGMLILSSFAKRGRTVTGPFDPYSVLRSIEDLFGFKPLGKAHGARSFLSQALPGA